MKDTADNLMALLRGSKEHASELSLLLGITTGLLHRFQSQFTKNEKELYGQANKRIDEIMYNERKIN